MSSHALPDAGEIFPQILDRMAKTRPDEIFITSIGEGSFSWAQFHDTVLRWTARFVALGVRRGDTVANLADAGLQSVSWWLGLSRLGAIDVGINTEFRGRILSYAINTSDAKVILVERQFLPVLEQVIDDLEKVRIIAIIDPAEQVGNYASVETVSLPDVPCDMGAPEQYASDPEWHNIAAVTYTSGTTGPSKAVMLPWAQLHCINLGAFPYEDMGPGDVIYCISTNAHLGSKCMPYLGAMIGGKVVMRKRFSGTDFWNDVATHKVTTVPLVGGMMDLLMRRSDAPGPETSLRNVFMAPLIRNYAEFNNRFNTRVCTVYNSSEGGVPILSGWDPADWHTCGRLREGYPGFEVRIVDENDFELPDGTMGEAIVRTGVPWTMNAGYMNNPEATSEAWRNGWFHTGDGLIRTEGGDYIFVDRIKDAIRRRGENISSFEVESDVMLNPDVEECAAVAVPSDDVEDEIMLYVVPREGSQLTPEALLRELMPRTARFMVPRYIEFVDELPRTDSTRRVKKMELRRRGLGPETWDRVAAGIELPRP